MEERSERLDHATRWLRDGMQAWPFVPTFFVALDADMTQSLAAVKALRDSGLKATYVHCMVRAGALALVSHPDLNSLVTGGRRHYPNRADIALSVAGETVAAPVMIIEGADRKSLGDLVKEISGRLRQTLRNDKENLNKLRKWGWVVPFSWARRTVLRTMLSRVATRRKMVGTFQMTISSDVDMGATTMFATSGLLTVGRVRDTPVVIEGQVVARPMVTMICCADHRAVDGRTAAKFLQTMRQILESGSF